MGVRHALAIMMMILAFTMLPNVATGQTDLGRETLIGPIEIVVQAAGENPTEFEAAQMVAAEWRKLGLEVKVTGYEWARLSELVFVRRNYEAAVVRYSGRAERIDPYHFVYQILHSQGRSNEVGYKSEEYDHFADLQNQLTDVAARRQAVFRAQEIAARDQPMTPIVNRNQIQVYSQRTFEGYRSMMGEGLQTFWNFVGLKPRTSRATVRYSDVQDNSTMNPVGMWDLPDFVIGQMIYDRLVRIDPEGRPQRWAALSITVVDPTTYRVKLRSNMVFHDGKPVTSEDVKFTYEYVAQVKESRLWGLVQPIKEVRIIGALTVEFVLKQPFASFVSNTLGQVFILPKHIFEKVLPENAFRSANLPPIGSGPFKFEYWQRGRELKLARNEKHFWRPAIDGVIRVPIPTVDGIIGSLERGETDFTVWFLEPAEAKRAASSPHLKLIEVSNHGFLAVDYNNRGRPFDQVAFRRGLAYAVPKARVLEVILEGRGTIAYSTVGPENKFWHNPNVEKVNYDLSKARQILRDAGYRIDSNGRLHYPRP